MEQVLALIASLARAENRRAKLVEMSAPQCVIALETANIRRKVARLRVVKALAVHASAIKALQNQTDAELAA